MARFWNKTPIIVMLSLLVAYMLFAVAFDRMLAEGIITTMDHGLSPPSDAPGTLRNLAEGNESQSEATSIDDTRELPETMSEDMKLLLAAQVALESATGFFEENLRKENGHIDIYHIVNDGVDYPEIDLTNSEAVSYYLKWSAKADMKEEFDHQIRFMRDHMLHPMTGHMMWKLDSDDNVIDDGANIASDADLRVIEALLIAYMNWNDTQYLAMIDSLASGLEATAITNDDYLAPYGGVSGGLNGTGIWTADEVWLSYSNFIAFDYLSESRGEPWTELTEKMKNAILEAQIWNGLYNSELTVARQHANNMDNGMHSINSLWIMVRSAESNDIELKESARVSLEFYKERVEENGRIYMSYSSDSTSSVPHDSPWVYALVGRAAVALEDEEFADEMIEKLLEFQINDPELHLHGAIIEGSEDDRRVGQFTMQESILTLQDYIMMKQGN